ncbi:MAG: KpsF/GutQ family sugar-phosphate isomerase [Kiritimatiellaeota bacterium]|nr:KpsF/GutQ family sugar-phosphate isomerase [Kiritimatiellota bacterium]
MSDIINKAREVFDIEMEALQCLRDNLNGEFTTLVEECVRILDSGGKLVLAGIGKSGHVGQKMAATLSSTGSTAVFMHPVEAMHGDLGILSENDLLITLSYSGETEELLRVLPAAKRLDVKIAAITGSRNSSLGKWSDITLEMPVPREACPFNLAPTATTTALLALGDALAMTLLDIRGFSKNDYGRLHPGGAIGKAVTMKVSDIMRDESKIARIAPSATVKETLLAMTGARCGSAAIIDNAGKLLGIFTDGDLRRNMNKDADILEKPVGDFMTTNPTTVDKDDLAVEVLKVIERKHIDDIIVLDSDGKVAGLVDVQDLPGLKLM